MTKLRGWDVAVLVAAVVLVALLVANRVEESEFAGGLAAIAALVIVWFALGRRGSDSPAAPVSMALLLVLGGVATAATPSMATMQAILFPLLWMLARTMREAILVNVLLAVSVAIGYVAGLGWGAELLLEIAVIEAISLLGSIAIGLWISRISVESAERHRLLGELQDTQDRLAAASREAGIVGERERLSRELHDTIAQDLTGLVLLTQRVRREVLTADPTVGETLDLLEDSARATLAETRALVASSAPVGLAEGGIVAALRRLGERIQRETGTTVTVTAPEHAVVERGDEVVLLRCAQEGLANVRRHAGATTASVTLRVDDAAVTLEVRDDGRGFDDTRERAGFGLDGLTDRLSLGGGRLSIDTAPGRGTVLTASLPRSTAPA
jgi:signal transduction histidine kinase